MERVGMGGGKMIGVVRERKVKVGRVIHHAKVHLVKEIYLHEVKAVELPSTMPTMNLKANRQLSEQKGKKKAKKENLGASHISREQLS